MHSFGEARQAYLFLLISKFVLLIFNEGNVFLVLPCFMHIELDKGKADEDEAEEEK